MDDGRQGEDWVRLAPEPLSVAEACAFLVRPDCGALALFAGTVRDHSPGRTNVRSIEYEAYEGPALERLRRIAAAMRERWPSLGRVVLWHRTGPVPLGEASVVVAVSAPHRADAFAACRFGIDTVKTEVPIWKLEHFDGGAEWVDARETCSGADGRDGAPLVDTA